MNKPKFSLAKARKAAEISSKIEKPEMNGKKSSHKKAKSRMKK